MDMSHEALVENAITSELRHHGVPEVEARAAAHDLGARGVTIRDVLRAFEGRCPEQILVAEALEKHGVAIPGKLGK